MLSQTRQACHESNFRNYTKWQDTLTVNYCFGLFSPVKEFQFSSPSSTHIDGLHVTSWGPCWCTGTIKFFSSGTKLPFLCKPYEQIFFCFVPQHGGNVNHLSSPNSHLLIEPYTFLNTLDPRPLTDSCSQFIQV